MDINKDADSAIQQVLLAVGRLQGEVLGVSQHLVELRSQVTDLKHSVSRDLADTGREITGLKVSLGLCDSQIKGLMPLSHEVHGLSAQVDRIIQESDKRARIETMVLAPLVTTLVLGGISLLWWNVSQRIRYESPESSLPPKSYQSQSDSDKGRHKPDSGRGYVIKAE